MKFPIKDPISYDEIYSSIHSYIMKNEGKEPAYMLIHPETRRNIIISSQDEYMGLAYHRSYMTASAEGIKSVEKMFGVDLLRSDDVEPGFIILCG